MMKNLFTSLFLLFSSSLFASEYYWVGGTGNWSDYANHWAASSGGSTFHTQVPTSSDNVFFDANSFSTAGQVVVIDAAVNCLSMNWTGVLNFPSVDGNGQILNIYGSLVLAADMTADFRFVEFESTSAGNTITTNGTSLGSSSITRLNGIGGEWTLQDNFTTDNITISAGTFNTNNNNINSGNFFTTSGSSAKVINLGSSEITTERWWITGTNQTINAGTSKIYVSTFKGDTQGDGPFTYYDVEFFNYSDLESNGTFNEITVPAGFEFKIKSGDVITVNNLVATGTKFETIKIISQTTATKATINKTSGSIVVEYVELMDVHATGGATFTANSSIDNGNTDGWTINAPISQDYYWVGNGGNWSDTNHWATTSGGSSFHSDYPGKFDDVFFDANSFSIADQIVTNDLNNASFHNMDWTGVTNTPTLDAALSYRLNAYGSITFDPGMHKDVYNLNLEGIETGLTFTALGSGSNRFITVGGTGEYDLLTNISCSSFSQYKGTVNFNDISLICSSDFTIGNFLTEPILNLETAQISCNNFKVNSGAIPTINIGTSQIIIDGILNVGGGSFYDVTMGENGSILGSNTFENLTVSSGSSLSIESGEIQTINQSLSLDGTKASPININSDATGVQATISMSSGTVDATYLIMQDIVATGGATFNADQTIDNGNNTGWNITGIVGESYYWVGNGGNWSDFSNHWVTSTGGSTFHSTAPGVLDDVFFDANSFSSPGEIVSIDVDEANFNNINATNVQNFTISGSGKDFNIYGSVTVPDNLNLFVSNLNFLSNNSETLNFSNGPGTLSNLNFLSSGTFDLSSDLTAGIVYIESGIINTNDNNVSATSLQFSSSEVKTLNLGTSSVYGGNWQVFDFTTNVTINGQNSDISVGGTFKVIDDVNDINLNNFSIVNSATTGDALLYDNLNVNRFTIEAGKTLKPIINATITTTEFIAVGTAEEPIILTPHTVGTSLTISQATGVVDAYYLEMEEVTATGGAIFNAYNSIDNGNVLGWIFYRENQTINFPALSDKVFNDPDFDLEATASSGLEVTFSITSGPAIINGNTLSITGVGTVQVKAEQAGNIDYNPAPSITLSFQVLKIAQTITFETIEDQLLEDGSLMLNATASSGLSVVYEITNGSATVLDNIISFNTLGSITVKASQPGDDDFNPAAPVEQSFEVISITGIDSENPVVGFYYYPNPVIDYLHIVVPVERTEKHTIYLIDIKGTIIKSVITNKETVLPMQELGSGVYFLKISGSGFNEQKIIIKK